MHFRRPSFSMLKPVKDKMLPRTAQTMTTSGGKWFFVSSPCCLICGQRKHVLPWFSTKASYIDTLMHKYIHYIHIIYTYTQYIHIYIYSTHSTYNTHIDTYIQSYIRTYIHTYIHSHIHTCIHTYIHAYIYASMHACICACMHTCMHTYIHKSHTHNI